MRMIIGMFVAVMIAGCVADPSDPSTETATSAIESTHWMVGDWNCKTLYHVSPEMGIDAEYSTVGTYEAIEESESVVVGQYREGGDSTHGPVNWDDRWEVGDKTLNILFNPGNIGSLYEQQTTPDSARQHRISSIGGIHPTTPTNLGSGLFGFIVSFSLPDSSFVEINRTSRRRWGNIPFIFDFPHTLPPRLLFDGRVETDIGQQRVYMQSDCAPAATNVLAVADDSDAQPCTNDPRFGFGEDPDPDKHKPCDKVVSDDIEPKVKEIAAPMPVLDASKFKLDEF